MKNKNYKTIIIGILTLSALFAFIVGCSKGSEDASQSKPKFIVVTGGYYVEGGLDSIESKKAAYSVDGIKWKTIILPSRSDWYRVCYGGD